MSRVVEEFGFGNGLISPLRVTFTLVQWWLIDEDTGLPCPKLWVQLPLKEAVLRNWVLSFMGVELVSGEPACHDCIVGKTNLARSNIKPLR